jgi:hypothetical protein
MRAFRLIATVALIVAPTVLRGQDDAAAFRKELTAKLDDAEKKLIALANAFPQEKFVWRPAPGALSVSEVFMHAVETNLKVPGSAGVAAASNVRVPPGGDTTIVVKARIVDFLTKSFVHGREAVMAVNDKKLDDKVIAFGSTYSKRGILELLVTRAREDIDKLAGYAQTNGIALPWSQ